RYITVGNRANGKLATHRVWNDYAGGELPAGEKIVEDNEWHHVVMTWKQNTPNGFKSYVDGEIYAQRNSVDVPLPYIQGNVIFGSIHGSGLFMKGILDDVAIYNRALSEQEVKRLSEDYSWTGAGIQNMKDANGGAIVVLAALE